MRLTIPLEDGGQKQKWKREAATRATWVRWLWHGEQPRAGWLCDVAFGLPCGAFVSLGDSRTVGWRPRLHAAAAARLDQESGLAAGMIKASSKEHGQESGHGPDG
jgi:hypothetical protein